MRRYWLGSFLWVSAAVSACGGPRPTDGGDVAPVDATDMAAKKYPIEFCTDVPWHTLGKKTGELAMALARGVKIPPNQFVVPVTAIVQSEASAALAEVQKMDKEAIALLGKYGG